MKTFCVSLALVQIGLSVTLPANIDRYEPNLIFNNGSCNLPRIPQINSLDFILVDSGIVWSMWTQKQECLGYNPFVEALQIVYRSFESYLYLNVAQVAKDFSIVLTDFGVYSGQFGPPHNPTSIASGFNITGSGPHISYNCGYITSSRLVGQFESEGWWSSYWDAPVDLGPGSVNTMRNVGKQLPNGNLIFIGIVTDDFSGRTKLIYRTYNSNLSTMLSAGQIHPDYRFYWGFDVNSGIAYVFYYDTLLNIYYRTTTDGINWSSEQVHNMVWPEPFDSNLVFWTQAVVMDNGEAKLIFDNIDYNDYIYGTYPYLGRIYVSPGSGLPCQEISLGLSRNFYPTIAAGGNYLIGLWHSQAGQGNDSLAFWNLYYNYSSDGGMTWHSPRNITSNFGYRHGLAQLAKRIDPTDNQFFYVFAQDIVMDVDPIWMCWRGWLYSNPARWYVGSQTITGIQENNKDAPGRFNLTILPNPARERAIISYTLPTSGNIELKIYTADGRLMKTILDSYKNAGRHSIHIPLNKFSNGIYFLNLKTTRNSLTRQFAVLR